MHIQTHILSGWCIGSLFDLTPRERGFCMIAAACSDVDGLGIVFGEGVYWNYHHVLGHNLLFAAIVSVALALASTHRIKMLLLSLGLFHLHFILDYYGSGPGWSIYYLWPFSRWELRHPDPWPFFSWQNLSAAGFVILWTLVIAVRQGRTPLEAVMPQLDRKIVTFLRNRLWTARVQANCAGSELVE